MELRFEENRRIACAVLAVCVLLGVFAFGGGALSRERSRAIKVFNEGTDSTLVSRHSMDAYLDSAADAARIMASEAELLLGGTPETGRIAEEADTLVDDSAGLDARYQAYAALKGDVEHLYSGAYGAASAEAFKNFKLAYDDFWGYDDLIARDEYHGLARSYNELISGFPGGVVAAVTGQGALNTFGG